MSLRKWISWVFFGGVFVLWFFWSKPEKNLPPHPQLIIDQVPPEAPPLPRRLDIKAVSYR